MPTANRPVADNRSMLSLLRAHWLSMAASVLVLVVSTALIFLQPLLAGRLVDRAAAGSPVLGLAGALVIMLAGQLLLEALAHFQLDRTGEKIVLGLRAVFTNHVVRLPIGLLDRGRSGDLLARGTSDAGLLRDMPRAIGDIVFGTLTLLGASIFMLSIDAVTVGVVTAVMAVAFTAGNPFLSRIQRASLNRQVALGDYTAGLDRTLTAARTVKLFGAEDREADSINGGARAAYGSGVRIASSTAINVLLIRLGVTGAFLAIMIIDGRRVADGGLSVGQFVSMFAFAMYAVFPITAGFTALANLRTAAGAYQHLMEILRDIPEGGPSPIGVSDRVETPFVAGTAQSSPPLVEFDHVSFSYGPHLVLDDVSFTLDRDQISALIGPSGAGKSTILALLCRFHDPSTGTVRWQGHDVRSVPLTDLRSRLGLLEQDAPVLHGTVRDNLLIADPDAGDADLWRVLEQANIAGEISCLPGQLDAPVLERGRGLSGGQRQRLALARALLSRSQLILMDEPTAHLDRANEYDVMTNLLRARDQRSVLVVAHRLSTVTNADQILVLQNGRIQATGTHSELLRMPVYRDLIEHELVSR
ncbi:ABC transporter ATP-binding protein [Mycobacterium kansasii]|uniref:ABC transporter ATP-binding protein n=1 Tax=Mycobacterium kansasii TaxID=1768 RepID=UPI000CDD470A|nr:ABC transporter ATP-binding protein [Mycobacterium kansasii]POX95664.1 ABC transporter ATP-binding protein [Mycobacterium kansasii]POY28535.1 ABC transporter ATP-binding protein [Mycobacterium kansasii]POY33668.1 ABC transporter ATP-binding protein [Mycobacterium kansasii]